MFNKGYNRNTNPKGTYMRIRLDVYVDLDKTPGTFHTKESAREIVVKILKDNIPHYRPQVCITDGDNSPA